MAMALLKNLKIKFMAIPKDLQSYFAGANMQRRVYQEQRGSRFLSGVRNFGRSALGGLTNFAVSAFNHHLAEKSAQSQYNRQLDFWRMQNEYNTPLAQRKRLEDAGLNPAVLAGDIAGNNTAGGLSSVPGNDVAQRGAIDHGSFLNSLQLLAQMESVGAGTDNMKRQIELSYAEELIKRNEAYGIELDNREKNVLLSWLNSEKRAALDNLLTDTESKKANTVGQNIDNNNKQRVYDDNHRAADDAHDAAVQSSSQSKEIHDLNKKLLNGQLSLQSYQQSILENESDFAKTKINIRNELGYEYDTLPTWLQPYIISVANLKAQYDSLPDISPQNGGIDTKNPVISRKSSPEYTAKLNARVAFVEAYDEFKSMVDEYIKNSQHDSSYANVKSVDVLAATSINKSNYDREAAQREIDNYYKKLTTIAQIGGALFN